MEIEKFARIVRNAVVKCGVDHTSRNNRKYHPVLAKLFEKHGGSLPRSWREFLTIGVLKHFECSEVKEYKLLPIYSRRYTEWMKIFYYDSICTGCGEHFAQPGPVLGPGLVKEFCSARCKNSSPITKERIKATWRRNYGFDHAQQHPDVIEKTRDTMMSRHGGYTLQSKSLKKKVLRTLAERYGPGVTSSSQVPGIKSRAVETYLKNHGKTQNPEGYEKTMERRSESFRRHYGVDARSPASIEEVREQISASHRSRTVEERRETEKRRERTCMERYGVPSPMNVPEILNKALSKHPFIKSVTIDSKTFKVQGNSEARVLARLVAQFGTDGVYTQFDPEFPRNYSELRCRPDFYIPAAKSYVEVKSVYTFMGGKNEDVRRHYSGDLKVNRRKARISNAFNRVVWIVENPQHFLIRLPDDWFTWRIRDIRRFIRSH